MKAGLGLTRKRVMVIAAAAFVIGYVLAPKYRAPRESPDKNAAVQNEKDGSSRFGFAIPRRIPLPESGREQMRAGQRRTNLLHRAGVTAEDIESAKALDERRRQGEFVLKNESPFLRKVRDYDFRVIAFGTASNNAAQYDELFSKLSVEPNASALLQTHIAKIHQASLEAELAISQVIHARQAFDTKARSSMNSEDYARYREYELMKPARYELEQIHKFAREAGSPGIPPETADAILTSIYRSGAVDPGWWHGPYDPLPDVRMGTAEVRAFAQESLEAQGQSTARLMQSLTEAALSREDADLVRQYYEKKMQARGATVEKIEQLNQQKSDYEEIRARLQQRRGP